jgi:hypothetical protein
MVHNHRARIVVIGHQIRQQPILDFSQVAEVAIFGKPQLDGYALGVFLDAQGRGSLW